MFSGAVPALLDWIMLVILSKPSTIDDVVVARRHRQAGLAKRGRAGGRGVLDALHRQAGEAELLHHPHAAHHRGEDVADVGRVARP